MNIEFDKEIDRLLRAATRQSVAAQAETFVAGAHLDTDALNLYVEKALSPAARATYTEHLADCAACRAQIALLARLSPAQIESPVAPETIAAPTAVASIKEERVSIWEKIRQGFFSPHGLVYAMPVLLLCVFGVAIFLFTSRQSRDAEPLVAEMRRQNADEPYGMSANMNAANMNSSMGNASTGLERPSNMNGNMNTMIGNDAPEHERPASGMLENRVGTASRQYEAQPQTPGVAGGGQYTPRGEVESNRMIEQSAVNGRQASAPTPFAPLPTPPPKANPANSNANGFIIPPAGRAERVEVVREARDAKKKESDEIIASNKARAATTDLDAQPTPAPSAPGTTATPDLHMLRGRAVRRGDSPAAASPDAPKRTVGDRRFTRRGAAWIDDAYTEGARITEVRRNSEQYRALLADEPGLRRIADALSGEVLVVWKKRAYRFR